MNSIKAHHLFPQVVFETVLPNYIDLSILISACYKLKSISEGRTISNVDGWQSDFLSSIIRHLEDYQIEEFKKINCFLENTGQRVSDITGLGANLIANGWVNINFPGSHNMLHRHPGCIYSSVVYLQTNPDSGAIVFVRDDRAPDYISGVNFIKRTAINASTFKVLPKPGAVLMFPAWLDHYVEPNKSVDDRISIAYNLITKHKKHEITG